MDWAFNILTNRQLDKPTAPKYWLLIHFRSEERKSILNLRQLLWKTILDARTQIALLSRPGNQGSEPDHSMQRQKKISTYPILAQA